MNDSIRSADRWIAFRAHAIVGDAPAMMHLFEKSIGSHGTLLTIMTYNAGCFEISRSEDFGTKIEHYVQIVNNVPQCLYFDKQKSHRSPPNRSWAIVWIYSLTEATQDISKMYAKVAVPAECHISARYRFNFYFRSRA